jgi:hypothetical protein
MYNLLSCSEMHAAGIANASSINGGAATVIVIKLVSWLFKESYAKTFVRGRQYS